jgi:hypothetical protein
MFDQVTRVARLSVSSLFRFCSYRIIKPGRDICHLAPMFVFVRGISRGDVHLAPHNQAQGLLLPSANTIGTIVQDDCQELPRKTELESEPA